MPPIMLTARFSSFFRWSYQNNGLSTVDLQLATRMKEGRCTPADEARLNTLLASPEGKTFFENPTVQRKLVKRVLDGMLTDQRVLERLKDCPVCLTEDEQIDLIRNRTGVIIHLSPERCAEIGFVLRFFCSDQQVALRLLNSHLVLPEARVESISNALHQKHQEGVAFETIANRMMDSTLHPWKVLSNEQLAQAILDKTENQLERQQFETMLASDKERVTFFNASAVQVMIVEALCNGRQIDPGMLVGLQHCAPNLPRDNQRQLAKAMHSGKFATASPVLQTVAQNLTLFTDPEAQRTVARAIYDRQFGTDSAVLLAIAQHLATFTDPQAQRTIAWAICARQFGTDSAVLLAIAQHLAIFIDSEAQRLIAEAIYARQFGTDSAVLQAVAQHLSIFTDPEMQYLIAEAIQNGKFGTNPAALQVVAQNLFIFTDPTAQQMIAKAIYEHKFGTDPDVLNAILKTIPQLLALLDTQTIIGLVSVSTLSVAEKIEALRERKLSLDLSATTLGIPEEDLPNLFGAKAYLGSEIKTLLPPHFPDATEDGIDSVCEDNLEYAIQIHHQQLILYPF